MYQARKVEYLPLILSASIHALAGLALFWTLQLEPGRGPSRSTEHLTLITLTPPVPVPSRQETARPTPVPVPDEDAAHPLHFESQATPASYAQPMPSRSTPGGGDMVSSAATPMTASVSVDPVYLSQLLRHLERFRRYPDTARAAGEQGVVKVGFALSRNGELLDAWIDHSSGFSQLDTEALATLRRAQPFPNLPKSLPDSFQTVVSLDFFLRDSARNANTVALVP